MARLNTVLVVCYLLLISDVNFLTAADFRAPDLEFDDEQEYQEFQRAVKPNQFDIEQTPPPGYETLQASMLSNLSGALGGLADTLGEHALRARDRVIGHDRAVLMSLADGTFGTKYPDVNGINIRNRAVRILQKTNNAEDLLKLADFYRKMKIKPTEFERDTVFPILKALHQKRSAEMQKTLQTREQMRAKLIADFDNETAGITRIREGSIQAVADALDVFSLLGRNVNSVDDSKEQD